MEQRLSEVMSRLNEQIFLNSPSEKYATLFSSRYDAKLRQLCCCSAGHLPPILLCNGNVRRLEAGGTVMGLFPQVSHQPASLPLEPGTIMVIFTDGVTEAVNEADEEFGEERLLEALQACRSQAPEGIYRHVIKNKLVRSRPAAGTHRRNRLSPDMGNCAKLIRRKISDPGSPD